AQRHLAALQPAQPAGEQQREAAVAVHVEAAAQFPAGPRVDLLVERADGVVHGRPQGGAVGVVAVDVDLAVPADGYQLAGGGGGGVGVAEIVVAGEQVEGPAPRRFRGRRVFRRRQPPAPCGLQAVVGFTDAELPVFVFGGRFEGQVGGVGG